MHARRGPARLILLISILSTGSGLPGGPAGLPLAAADAAPQDAPPPRQDAWLEAEPLGLRFRPPTPALVKADTIDGVFRYEVVDAEETPRWWLRFQFLTSSTAGLTAHEQVEAYRETLVRNGKEFTVRLDEPIRPSGALGEGRLLVIEAPVGDGSSGLSGWLLVPTGTDRFLAASLAVPSSGLDSTLPALRDAFRAMEVTSLDAIEAAKRERVARGERMLAVTPERLRAAIRSEPLVYRIYRPAAGTSGEVELGWMTVRVAEGKRGEVDPSRNPERYRGDDHDSGLLVTLDAKSLVGSDARSVIDTQTRAWLAWDRSSEIWSTRSTQRQGTASRSTAQTGIRTPTRPGQPRPRLEVINSAAERQSRDPLDWTVPPNYISQAELVILGRLLSKDDPNGEPYSSYAFDPRTNTLPQRTDHWRRNSDGTWTLETRMAGSGTGGGQALVQIFDADGDRVKRIDHDGAGPIVTERIEVDALRAIWRRKGLPLE